MEKDRETLGWAKIQELGGDRGIQVHKELLEFFPAFGNWAVKWGYGEVWSRDALDVKQRELVTLAALTVMGDSERALNYHIRAALRVGLTPHEVTEAIQHCVGYIGVPRVMNALYVLKSVFEELGVELPKE